MEKKTISMDPSLLSLSSSGGNKSKGAKQRRNTEKKKHLIQVKPDNVKELLLKKLKEYKKNKSKKQKQIPCDTLKKVNPDFMEKLRNKRNKTEQHVSMGAFLPEEQVVQLNHTPISAPLAVQSPAPVILPAPVPVPASAPQAMLQPLSIQEPPPYSNMKHTSKPTFREWTNIQTPTVVESKPIDNTLNVEIKKRFTVGKNKTCKKVGIFLKNSIIRRNVEDHKSKWKNTNLKTVKNYLKKNNLIRYGSNAPNELIREIYETTKMVGGIKNKNGTLLVNNFLQDKEE